MPGSQTPLVVTMLTVHVPSNDAAAGAMPAPMIAHAANALAMARLLTTFSKITSLSFRAGSAELVPASTFGKIVTAGSGSAPLQKNPAGGRW
jgi:hypothetical protein